MVTEDDIGTAADRLQRADDSYYYYYHRQQQQQQQFLQQQQQQQQQLLSPKILIMQPILRFLQLLCENHNRDLQVHIVIFRFLQLFFFFFHQNDFILFFQYFLLFETLIENYF